MHEVLVCLLDEFGHLGVTYAFVFWRGGDGAFLLDGQEIAGLASWLCFYHDDSY